MTIHTQCRVTVPGWPDVPVEIELPDDEPRCVPTEKALLAIGKAPFVRFKATRVAAARPARSERSANEWPVDPPFQED